MLLNRKLNDYITNVISPTDGMTVSSVFASLLQKISAATDCQCQIMLNRKLSHKFKKLCKFASRVKAKSHKNKSRKMRPDCTVFHLLNTLQPPTKLQGVLYKHNTNNEALRMAIISVHLFSASYTTTAYLA